MSFNNIHPAFLLEKYNGKYIASKIHPGSINNMKGGKKPINYYKKYMKYKKKYIMLKNKIIV
jgi:hypothetical protein